MYHRRKSERSIISKLLLYLFQHKENKSLRYKETNEVHTTPRKAKFKTIYRYPILIAITPRYAQKVQVTTNSKWFTEGSDGHQFP
jgi:hypothetical protein